MSAIVGSHARHSLASPAHGSTGTTPAAQTPAAQTLAAQPLGSLQIATIPGFTAGAVFTAGSGEHPDGHTIAPGTTIVGGAISGTIDTIGATLDGLTHGPISITERGLVRVEDGSTLTTEGTIGGSYYGGTIMLDGTQSGATLAIDGIVHIGATLALSDNSRNLIEGLTSNARLTINHYLTGAGTIGNGTLALFNSGYIEATGTNALLIDNTGVFKNTGNLEGTGAGGLTITSSVFTNTGAIYAASGSSVTIAPGLFTNLAAGTLTGGFYEAVANPGSTATLAFGAPVTTDDAKDIYLYGRGASITANGAALGSTLALVATGAGLDVADGARFASQGTFTDSGYVELSAGTLTGAALAVSPTGSVADYNTGTSRLAFTGNIVNDGTILAGYGGKLSIAAADFTNTGVVTVSPYERKASTIVIAASHVSNLAAGTLTGGTWSVGSLYSAAATLDIQDGRVTSDAAVIDLFGNNATFDSGGTSLASSLAGVAAGGQLNLAYRTSFYSRTAGITDAGTISLAGGEFAGNSLTIAAGGLFTGTGDLVGPIVDNGTLEAAGGRTLLLNAAVTGTGLLESSSDATLNPAYGYDVGSVAVDIGSTLIGAGTATGAIDIAGQLMLQGGTLSGGSITIGYGGGDDGLLSGNGTVAQHVASTGTISAYAGTLTLAAGESGGVLKVQASASLVSTSGGIADVTALNVLAGATFTGYGTVIGVTNDTGTLVAAGGNLSLATEIGTGAATITSAATLTVATPAIFSAGITFDAAGTATLALGTPAGNTALLTSFAATDTIDLLHTTITAATFSQATNLLTLSNGTTTLGTLHFAGTYAAASFALQSDGANGTDITYAATPLTDLRQAAAIAIAHPALLALPTEISRCIPPSWSAAYERSTGLHLSDLIFHHS